MKTKWKVALGTVGALAVAGGVYGSIQYGKRNIVTVQTGKTVRQDLTALVTASGEIKPRNYINIGSNAAGPARITQILVVEGQSVRKGQLLAQLESVQPEAEVAAQKASVASSEAESTASEAGLQVEDENTKSLAATLVSDASGSHDWLQIDAAQKTPFLNATNVLVEKGWLQQSENTEGSAFYCHPIIQFAVKAQMKPDVGNCGVLIGTFCELLYVDTDNGEHGVFKQELLPYGESIFEAVYKKDSDWTKKDEKLSILGDRLGWIYYDLGNFNMSLEYVLVHVSISEKILESNDVELATAYANLSSAYGALGNHSKRLEYNIKALAIYDAILDKQHPNLATCYNNIAETYGALDNHEKRLEYNLIALNIF